MSNEHAVHTWCAVMYVHNLEMYTKKGDNLLLHVHICTLTARALLCKQQFNILGTLEVSQRSKGQG